MLLLHVSILPASNVGGGGENLGCLDKGRASTVRVLQCTVDQETRSGSEGATLFSVCSLHMQRNCRHGRAARAKHLISPINFELGWRGAKGRMFQRRT